METFEDIQKAMKEGRRFHVDLEVREHFMWLEGECYHVAGEKETFLSRDFEEALTRFIMDVSGGLW